MAGLFRAEMRLTVEATEGDKVQVVVLLVSYESLCHEGIV